MVYPDGHTSIGGLGGRLTGRCGQPSMNYNTERARVSGSPGASSTHPMRRPRRSTRTSSRRSDEAGGTSPRPHPIRGAPLGTRRALSLCPRAARLSGGLWNELNDAAAGGDRPQDRDAEDDLFTGAGREFAGVDRGRGRGAEFEREPAGPRAARRRDARPGPMQGR